MKIYLIFFFIVATVVAVSATDYCAMNCIVDGKEVKHVACGHNGSFALNCKSNIELVPITEDVKKVILHEHNLKRNLVAGGGNSALKFPPACRMATVQWDDELAKLAEMKAQLCDLKIRVCHSTESFPNSGEAVNYVVGKQMFNTTDIMPLFINNWFNIIVDQKLSGSMLVDRNIRLGCAITSVMIPKLVHRKKIIHNIYKLTVICNYSTDFSNDTPLYDHCEKAGDLCKYGKNDEYNNLCSKEEIYE